MRENFKEMIQKRSASVSSISKIIILFVFVIGLTACGTKKDSYDSELMVDYMLDLEGEVVGTIGDIEIKDFEYKYCSNLSKYSLMQELNGMPFQAGSDEEKEFWETEIFTGMTLGAYAEDMTSKYLSQLAISLSKAKEEDIVLTEEDFKELNERIKDEFDFTGQNRKVEDVIKEAYDISISEYISMAQKFDLASKYALVQQKKLEPTESDLKQEYEKNLDSLEQATVVHVLFMYENEEGRTREESKVLAEDILKRVKAGEDIKELAIEYSEDGGITTNEGEYTFSRRDPLVEEFINWSFEAEVGDADIVETTYGYHVMKLMDKYTISFEEVKEDIKQNMQINSFTDMLFAEMDSDKFEVKLDEELIKNLK